MTSFIYRNKNRCECNYTIRSRKRHFLICENHSKNLVNGDLHCLPVDITSLYIKSIDNNITDRGLHMLDRYKKLKRLHFSGKHITAEGLIYLKDISHLFFGNLPEKAYSGVKYLISAKTIDFGERSEVTDDDLSYLKDINVLRLGRNEHITDKGIMHLENVKSLELYCERKITNAGLQNMEELVDLNIECDGSSITNDGFKHMTKLEELRVLLGNNSRVTKDIIHLLPNIRYLDLNGTEYFEDDIQSFRMVITI